MEMVFEKEFKSNEAMKNKAFLPILTVTNSHQALERSANTFIYEEVIQEIENTDHFFTGVDTVRQIIETRSLTLMKLIRKM